MFKQLGVATALSMVFTLAYGADIVVIGAGGAGLSAALTAQQAGKDVVVLEKMAMVGGNTIRATGGLNAAQTLPQSKKGIKDSIEVMYEDTMKGGYHKNNPDLVKVLSSQAKDSVAWLLSLKGDFNDVGRLAGATNYRAHRPTGGAAVGPELVRTLYTQAKIDKVDIRTMSTVTSINLDQKGAIESVTVKNRQKTYTIDTKAVVLATGGFSANQSMVVDYVPRLKGFATTNHPGATGDGIVLAKKVNADFVDMVEIQTHPTVVAKRGVMITEAVRGNGAILINKDGKRFIDELQTRDVVSKAVLEQKDGVAYLVFDEGIRQSLKAIEGYVKKDLTTQAPTLELLAGKLNMPSKVLAQSIKEYNLGQKSKKDAFGRPDMPRALTSAQYYAIEITPAVHHTMGGVKINTKAQVINKKGQVIPGLFAAGEITGGVHGGNRLGGNALADIVTFGRIAGHSAVIYVK